MRVHPQDVHASAEQRAAAAEKSVRGIQRELTDLEAAVRAQVRQPQSQCPPARILQFNLLTWRNSGLQAR